MKSFRLTTMCALIIGLCVIVANAQMTIHHINVGQGEAMLLEFPRAAVLIDAGGSAVQGDRYKQHLINYLDDFFENRPLLQNSFYSFIITHPHIDHTSFVMDIFRRYKVRNFVDNGDVSSKIGQRPVNEARAFIDQANAERPNSIIYNKIRESQISNNGYQPQWFRDLQTSQSAEIRFLNASKDCDDENNDSLVVLVRYGNTKMLVTGDAEWESDSRCIAAIPRMLARYANGDLMDVDIYKVGHHGSHNATNEAYLQEMTPRISLISAGHYEDRNANNSAYTAYHYGHPRDEAVNMIINATTNTRPRKRVYFLDLIRRGNRYETVKTDIDVTKAVYCTCWDGDVIIPTNTAGTLLTPRTTNWTAFPN